MVQGAITKAKAPLGIASPSKLFEGFGEMTVRGYVAGVEQRSSLAAHATGKLAGEAARGFGETPAFTTPPSTVQSTRVLETTPTATPSQGRSVPVNVTNHFHLTLPPGATEEDGRRFAEGFGAEISRQLPAIFEDLALTLSST
ncbi:MAG: hypothetical protein DIU78_004120 [Pseudomonadota bacterium]|nr:MAG: hypothetical protein DIU78_04955 [Pseudomonadota bacterium]